MSQVVPCSGPPSPETSLPRPRGKGRWGSTQLHCASLGCYKVVPDLLFLDSIMSLCSPPFLDQRIHPALFRLGPPSSGLDLFSLLHFPLPNLLCDHLPEELSLVPLAKTITLVPVVVRLENEFPIRCRQIIRSAYEPHHVTDLATT